MKKHTLAKTYGIIFLVLLLALAVGTFAWFINNDNVKVDTGTDMAIQVGKRLQIALATDENESFGDRIELDFSEQVKKLTDCTGDGIHFLGVRELDKDKQPTFYDKITTDAQKEGCMIEVPLKFKTSFPMDVMLDWEQGVGGAKTQVSPLSEDPSANTSIAGLFTANYIAGCARVSFSEVVDGTEELRFVWIPNDKYEIDAENLANGVNPSGTRETSYKYMKIRPHMDDKPNYELSEVEGIEYSVEDYLNGTVLVGNFPECYHVKPVVSFTQPAGVEVVKTVIMRIWFEGTDREAHTALNQGLVKFSFNFTGRDKAVPSVGQLERFDGIVYNESSDQLIYEDGTFVGDEVIYSTNGIDWGQVGPELHLRSVGASTIYLKLKETTSTYSSDRRTDGAPSFRTIIIPPASGS